MTYLAVRNAKRNSASTALSAVSRVPIAIAVTATVLVPAATLIAASIAERCAKSVMTNSVTPALPKDSVMIASIDKNKRRNRKRSSKGNRHVLRFTPYAMAKLLFLRDSGPTEVGGFGISSAEDLLLVEDVRLVQQVCSAVSVEFDDDSVADYFDEQVDCGRQPEEFARIWIHTHPGASPSPSVTDEETFDRCFGGSDWCVMYILAQGGNSYARARFNVGPRCDRRLRCRTQLDCEFPASDQEAWYSEYCKNVLVHDPFLAGNLSHHQAIDADWWAPSPVAFERWIDEPSEVGG